MTVADNFDKCYEVQPDGCWEWLRARKGKEAKRGGGYGCFKYRGRTVGAHKFAYERAYGPVPKGLQVMHLCHNTLCVNPSHLAAGTNDENQRARAMAGRTQAKLTPDDVRAIRRRFAAGELQREIAEDFGLYQCDVSNIVHRKYWAHVE